MRDTFLLLLILSLLISAHGQQGAFLQSSQSTFDSAVPVPVNNVDVAQTQPNLRIQNQQSPAAPNPSVPVQNAPTPTLPQQPAAQNIPAGTTTTQQATSSQSALETPAEPPKILLSEIDHPIVGRGFRVDNGISYQRIKVGQLSQKYLFFNFKLAEKDKWQLVNITISLEGSQQILNLCQYAGVDNCYVPAFSLKPQSVLFVHVQCQDDCTYNLNAQWSDTQHLRPGEEALFMFGKDTTQIYHVQLDNQDDFEEMRIHLAPRVTRRPFDNVKIYGKYGKDSSPTPQNYDFKSVNLWQDGEGIFIRKADLKQKKMVLLVVGQTETTYRLSLELVRQPEHEIENGEHIYEYLPAKSEKSYHIKSIPNAFDEYSLRLSVLSGGDLDVGYFTDKELKNKLEFQPFEFMKDSEYVLNAQLLDPKKDGLFIRIKSQEKDATYTIKFVGRKRADSIQLNENVYGFIQVHNESRFAHFDFKRWAEETETQANMKFTVYIIEAKGKVTPEFFVCQSTLSLCTNPNFYKNATIAIPAKAQGSLSQKLVYQLQVEDKLLKKINIAEQQAIVVVKLNPDKPAKGEADDFSLVAIELLNNNKVLYLRQGRPLEQKMNPDEVKVYKYINSDPKVEEIRIHINEITGVVNIGGFIQNEDSSKSLQVAAEGNTLRFTTNLTQPIYVSVGARTKAIFGISMQVIHKTSIQKNITVATISQDLTYKVRIQPNSYAIYEVVPIFYHFNFKYSASQSIVVCAINPKTNSCIDPNGTKLYPPNLDVRGTITDAILVDRKARIKITNPFSDSVAEVTFIFHSRQSGHCEDKPIGHFFDEVVNDGDCYSFNLLDQKKTLDLYISKREFASFNYRVLVCDNILANASTVKNLEISPEVVAIMCAGSRDNRRVSVIWSVTTKNIEKQERTLRVNLLAQYRGDLIMIPQGVSYNRVVTVQDNIVGKFAFSIINKRNTRIVLNQLRGTFIMYAKITEQGRRQSDPISNLNHRYASSQTVAYSQEPTIIIPQADIQKEYCRDCIILIAVYTDIPQGFEVQFDIEVTQKYSALSEDSALEGYLDRGSFAFYSYQARSKTPSTILFLLSDHNSQCANMYLSTFENVGPAAHLFKTSGENQLIYRHNGGDTKYYLAVQAIKTCDYSISVLTIDSSIHNLKRGRQNLIKFPAGVVKYFSLQHSTNQPFKILSLAKYGEINIYINKSSLSVNRKTFTTDELALSKFQYKSPHKNSLLIDNTSPLFCERCTYFVAIQALKNTEATLYLVYPQTTVTLTQGHFLSDYLAKKMDFTIASYKRIEKTQFKLRVYSGTLKVYTFYKDRSTTNEFSASDREQTFQVDYSIPPKEKKNSIPQADPTLGKNPDFSAPTNPEEKIPVNIMVTSQSDNVSYTLQVVSLGNGTSINQLAAYQSLIPGQPNHISISSAKPLCLTGYLRDPNETLLLSANNDNREYLNQLVMQANLSGEKADISKTFTRNILGITLAPSKAASTPTTASTKGIKFELCFKLPEPQQKQDKISNDSVTEVSADTDESLFNATITQANTVNILPSDTDSEVKGESIFVIHSDGQFLLDVFECKDQAKISVGNSLENIEKSKLKMLEMVSMPDQRHAVKVSEKSTTFVKIHSTHSIVRWIPIDYEADRGLGYIKYSSGDLRYSSKFKQVVVEYQPLQQAKPSKSKVTDIKYTLYISNETQSMDFSSQCSTEAPNVLKLDLLSPPLKKTTEREYLSRSIEKQELQRLFAHSENIYLSVVCDLSLSILGDNAKAGWDEHEHYKFIYPRQQLPLQIYQQNQIESIPYHYLVLLLAAVGAILVLCTYLFTRKIVPLLARLKNSNLVEEEPAQEHKDDLEVPASSDRNQRAPDIAVETEDKFGK